MVYELIAEKLSTLKDGHRRVSGDATTKVNLLKNRISEINIAEQKLVDLIIKDSVEPDMLTLLNKRARKLADEKRELASKIEELEADATELVHVINFSRRWKSATYEERRAVCNVLIDRILIDQDGTTEIVWNI